MRVIMWSNSCLWTLTWVLEKERIGGVHRTGMIIIQSVLRHGFGNIVMVESQLSLCCCSGSFHCTSSCRFNRTPTWWFTLNLVYSGMWHCAVCFIVPDVLPWGWRHHIPMALSYLLHSYMVPYAQKAQSLQEQMWKCQVFCMGQTPYVQRDPYHNKYC